MNSLIFFLMSPKVKCITVCSVLKKNHFSIITLNSVTHLLFPPPCPGTTGRNQHFC